MFKLPDTPKQYDIIIYSNHAWPEKFCLGLAEEVIPQGVRMTSSNGTSAIIGYQCIYWSMCLKFCPKRVLSMFDMSISRICSVTITPNEVNNIIQEYRNNAATCIQRAVLCMLYKPPTGAMYLRLSNKCSTI